MLRIMLVVFALLTVIEATGENESGNSGPEHDQNKESEKAGTEKSENNEMKELKDSEDKGSDGSKDNNCKNFNEQCKIGECCSKMGCAVIREEGIRRCRYYPKNWNHRPERPNMCLKKGALCVNDGECCRDMLCNYSKKIKYTACEDDDTEDYSPAPAPSPSPVVVEKCRVYKEQCYFTNSAYIPCCKGLSCQRSYMYRSINECR